MLDRTFLLDSRFSRFNARLIRDEANDEKRKAIAIRNDEKRSGTGRNNLFVIVIYCENRRKFRESFREKKSARIRSAFSAPRDGEKPIFTSLRFMLPTIFLAIQEGRNRR